MSKWIVLLLYYTSTLWTWDMEHEGQYYYFFCGHGHCYTKLLALMIETMCLKGCTIDDFVDTSIWIY